MKNLTEELEKAIMERFKYSKIAAGLEKYIAERIEIILFEKYKATKILLGDSQFELYGIKCSNISSEEDAAIPPFLVSLVYFNISELTDKQKKQLEEMKDRWKRDQWIGYYNEEEIGVLHIQKDYEYDPDSIDDGVFDLEISDVII
jgi:hypothetical protein